MISLVQNKSKDSSSSSNMPIKSKSEPTSISLINDTESIKKQEPKKQVNIVISYIEQNDEQGIGQSVNLSSSLSYIYYWLQFFFWYILVPLFQPPLIFFPTALWKKASNPNLYNNDKMNAILTAVPLIQLNVSHCKLFVFHLFVHEPHTSEYSKECTKHWTLTWSSSIYW